MKHQTYLPALIIVLIFAVFQACGEDPASMGGAIPPELPQFDQISIDDSYFLENEPADPQSQQYEAYMYARQGILSIASELPSVLDLPMIMLMEAAEVEPILTNGIWAWEYEYTIPAEIVEEEVDITTEVRVTAQAGNTEDETNWSIFVSAEDTPVGPLESFNLANATISNDGSTGTFELFNPEEPEVSDINVAWNISSEDEKTLTLLFRDDFDQNSGTTEIVFTQSGSSYSFSVTDSFSESVVIVSWNTLTGTGSISTPEGLSCWDENLMNTDC